MNDYQEYGRWRMEDALRVIHGMDHAGYGKRYCDHEIGSIMMLKVIREAYQRPFCYWESNHCTEGQD